jgi:hypothetical protein
MGNPPHLTLWHPHQHPLRAVCITVTALLGVETIFLFRGSIEPQADVRELCYGIRAIGNDMKTEAPPGTGLFECAVKAEILP